MSTNRAEYLQISRRYATALFELAVEAKKEAAVAEEMGVLARAIEGSAELADTLASPIVTNAQKAAVLAALVAKADGLTQKAVATMAEGGRASLIPAVYQEIKLMLAERNGELEAVVTSARPLSASIQKQLGQSLAKATGKKVELTLKEDARVLGGVLIELGSLRLDATLSGALNHMREQLLATSHS